MGIQWKFGTIALPLLTAAGLGCPVWPSDSLATGPTARISVASVTQVSKANANRAHAEVILAADPGNCDRLLAGSIVMNPGMGSSVVAYASADGGTTWQPTLEKKAEQGGVWYGDPAVAYGPDGAAYFAAMVSAGLGLEIVASRDGGRSWGMPFRAKHLVDRPFLVTDCTRGRFRGRLYCAENSGGELAVYRALDGARAFEPPQRLVCKGSAQGRNFGQGVVLSDGMLVLPYHVMTRATERQYSLRVQRSNTGGESFLGEQLLRDYHADRPVIPILAADPGSGAFKDRLYLVWFEQAEAGTRIMLTVSKDRGVNWSEPVCLSDEVGVVREAKANRHDAFLPSVAVNRAGVVAVSWYDGTLHGGTLNTTVRLRASVDGGITWLPSVRVTEFIGRSDRAAASAPGSESWVGDTAGLAADASGAFHPLWIDNRTGIRQVLTARVVIR